MLFERRKICCNNLCAIIRVKHAHLGSKRKDKTLKFFVKAENQSRLVFRLVMLAPLDLECCYGDTDYLTIPSNKNELGLGIPGHADLLRVFGC